MVAVVVLAGLLATGQMAVLAERVQLAQSYTHMAVAAELVDSHQHCSAEVAAAH
jgi:hypothetical protein